MSKHIHRKELSAYLDGQARDPGAIQRHLQQCPECARLHMELWKVRGRLQDTPPEKPGSAFTARVMKAVREEAQPAESWGRQYPWALAASAAVVVVVVLCAGLAVFTVWEFENGMPRGAFHQEESQTPSEPDPLLFLWLAELEEATIEEEYRESLFYEPAHIEVLLTMAEDPWLEDTAAVYETETNVEELEELVETMDEESTDIFVDLLAAYDQEAWTP